MIVDINNDLVLINFFDFINVLENLLLVIFLF